MAGYASLSALLFYATGLFLLNHGLGRWLLVRGMQRIHPGAEGFLLRLDRATFDPALRLRLEGVEVRWGTGPKDVRLFARTADCLTPLALVLLKKEICAVLRGGRIEAPAVTCQGIAVVLHDLPLRGASPSTQWLRQEEKAAPPPSGQWVGALRISRLTLGEMAFQNVSSSIRRSPTGFHLAPLTARLSSGRLTGSLALATRPPLALAADFRASEIPLRNLAAIQPAMFRKAEGRGFGTLSVQGNAGGAVQWAATFEVEEPGGQVEAQFLKTILPYVPAAARTEELRRAIRNDLPLRFQRARFQVTSVTHNELKALLFMTLPEYNHLALDIDFTIRLDATFTEVMGLWGKWKEDSG